MPTDLGLQIELDTWQAHHPEFRQKAHLCLIDSVITCITVWAKNTCAGLACQPKATILMEVTLTAFIKTDDCDVVRECGCGKACPSCRDRPLVWEFIT